MRKVLEKEEEAQQSQNYTRCENIIVKKKKLNI
jgi:hypothetical protein